MRPAPRPAYYMINCAHPTHFEAVLDGRAGGASASAACAPTPRRCSHAELDEATELDEGDPADLAARYARPDGALPSLNVLGGCCGTDHRHVAAIAGGRRSAQRRPAQPDQRLSCGPSGLRRSTSHVGCGARGLGPEGRAVRARSTVRRRRRGAASCRAGRR